MLSWTIIYSELFLKRHTCRNKNGTAKLLPGICSNTKPPWMWTVSICAVSQFILLHLLARCVVKWWFLLHHLSKERFLGILYFWIVGDQIPIPLYWDTGTSEIQFIYFWVLTELVCKAPFLDNCLPSWFRKNCPTGKEYLCLWKMTQWFQTFKK